MRVLNLSPLAGRLDSLVRDIRLGDHVLYFEHQEDGQFIRCVVHCSKCCSERESFRPKSALLSAPSEDVSFFELFYLALKAFESDVHLECAEAAKVVTCKEVLET